MARCTTENWTMKEISNALKDMSHDGKRIVVPRFQRGKSWNSKQEEMFIDSLRKGFPVGTLLFYKTSDVVKGRVVETYTLVDGLQRGTAIKNYISNPMPYFSEENIDGEMLDAIFQVLDFQDSQKEIIKKRISELYLEFIHGLPSFENVQLYFFAYKVANELPSTKGKDMVIEKLIGLLPQYFAINKEHFDSIANAPIPAVVFTGREEDLPEIFTRINSQGTPLNQFEIYAASWPQTDKYEIRNDKVIEYVMKKYDELHDDIYTIKDYDREEIRISKKLTVFEYVFGFSKWITNEFLLLGFDKKDKPDEISSIGFELLDACIFDTKNIGELYKELQKININKLEKRLVEAIKYVDSIVAPIIRFKGNRRTNDGSLLYSKNQILSMIAFVFREKYTLANLNDEKIEWKDKEPRFRELLLLNFVYDIIRKEWFEGGAKLHTAINSKKYYDNISASAWESTLNSMFEESLKKRETKSVRNPSNVDLVFLNCIYMDKFSALQQLSINRFDVEHIATKELMKKLISVSCGEEAAPGLPIGSIANLCYLPEHENRAKGSNTFYQDSHYLSTVSIGEIENKYSFTRVEDLEWCSLDNFEQGDFDELQEWYLDFLKNRFEKQKKEFYSSLKIDSTMINTQEVQRISSEFLTSHAQNTKEVRTGESKNKVYCDIKANIQASYNCVFNFKERTIIESENGKYRFALAFSKKYTQGVRNKYWFAYHPEKLDGNKDQEQYYVFACNDDNLSIVIPRNELEKRCKNLNKSDSANGVYFHIVLFVDFEKNVTWLLSKPSIQELSMNNCKLKLLSK